MPVAMPTYAVLKANIVTVLREVATEENAIDIYRNFVVSQDRWRPWIENQHGVALVNVMVDTISSGGGGTHHAVTDKISVNIDMYVLGTVEEQINSETDEITLIPYDEQAAARLDLLVAQVRHAISRMKNSDLGFSAGEISRNISASLNIYNQEGSNNTGCYAPARWNLSVDAAYRPADDATVTAITELNLAWKDTLESWASKYPYPVTP